MNEIDWSKAPEGATHYHPSLCHPWLRVRQQSCHPQCYQDGLGWVNYRLKSVGMMHLNDAITRQHCTEPTIWNGAGLPPVGIDIECLHEIYGWIGAKVVGHDGEAAIVRTNDGYAGLFPHQFRPIRTPEQIAAEDREKAVSLMVDACPYAGSHSTRIDCEALYDAGYRKMEA
ncbi:hypothetical protein [Pseudomonas sp.]|uniref:hypothetical protein n=1 Tax=Pseudomonas sp. TaxID=306 RepID=UPI00258B67BC|nr:hypothetical protein [Pseudomonas sp.]